MLLNSANTQSIWTVDLVMLLENMLRSMDTPKQKSPDDDNNKNDSNSEQRQLEPNHDNTTYLFCSEVMGVNTSHSTTGYYEAAFSNDSERVTGICEDMSTLELPQLCPFHLEFRQLIDLISHPHCVAIVLVDNNILMESQRDELSDLILHTTSSGIHDGPPPPSLGAPNTNVKDHDNNATAHNRNDSYMGHYVIATGISRDPDHLVAAFSTAEIETLYDSNDLYCLVVVNPGISHPTTVYLSPKRFEQCWRAEGTDCDVIFVAKH